MWDSVKAAAKNLGRKDVYKRQTLIQRRLYDIMQNNPEELTAIYKDLIAQELVENDKVHTTLYGCYGYAATLMMLIPAITQTFGISALPVSYTHLFGNKKGGITALTFYIFV